MDTIEQTLRRDEVLLAGELNVMGNAVPQFRSALLCAWRAACLATDPQLFRSTQQRVEATLGVVDEPVGEPGNPLLAAAADLVDQFVFYVPDVTESHLAPIRAHLGEAGLESFIQALYVIDQTARLRLTHKQLFAPEDTLAARPFELGAALGLRDALARLHATAMRLHELDDMTSEIVRLRAASYHHCRLCMSLRLFGASGSVVNEDLASRVARSESSNLSERHKVAIRYADTHMTVPRKLEPQLCRQLAEHYTRRQIIELTLDVSQWNQQKILVALGTDSPVSEAHLTPLTFDADGHAVFDTAGSAS